MTIRRFEELQVWQKARAFTVLVYKALENSKDFGFKDQLQRASVSVMNNIAEGFERKSDTQFDYFLKIAKGSSGEVRSMLYLALDLNKISQSEFELLLLQSEEISKMIVGLSKSLKRSRKS